MVFTLQSIHSYYHIYLLLIQVASLVIQEHKGRRLAPLLKLAVVCEEYSGKPFSSGIKADVQVLFEMQCGIYFKLLNEFVWVFLNMGGGRVSYTNFFLNTLLSDWVDERNGRSLGQTTNDRRHDFVRRGWRDCNCTRGLWKSKKVILTFDEFSQSNKLIWNTNCNC